MGGLMVDAIDVYDTLMNAMNPVSRVDYTQYLGILTVPSGLSSQEQNADGVPSPTTLSGPHFICHLPNLGSAKLPASVNNQARQAWAVLSSWLIISEADSSSPIASVYRLRARC